ETDKYFYVWLDAPIGYIAAPALYARESGKVKDARAYWAADADSRIEHVIGKDSVYFHALFWPAVLKTAGLKQPDRIIVHGHLTVNGEKMSKSRGTMISARRYLEALDPSYLRYFFAANLSATPEDIDLSLEDFRLRVNGELVNNLGNLANRALSMLASRFKRRLAPVRPGPGQELVASALRQVPAVRAAYEKLDLRPVAQLITAIAAGANAFLQTPAPCAKLRTDGETANADLSAAAEVVYIGAALLVPIVRGLSTMLLSPLDAARLSFEQPSK